MQAFSNKYQKIRQRFFEKFYYEGQIAEWIEDDRIKFADQTIYMGQALIFLVSELYIKVKLNEETESTIQSINEILANIDQLDLDAESLYGHTPSLNGFIVRDNIIGPNDPRIKNRFPKVDTDWQTPENAAPSGDQIFGLFFGFWATIKLVKDATIEAKVKALSERIFLYAKVNKFELKLPNGELVERGADMRWLSSLLHGLNKIITGADHFDDCRINVLGFDMKLTPIATFWDDAGNNAADILGTTIHIPLLGEYSINSFAAHMLLMAIAPSSVWSQGELEKAALSINHHLAVLIYALAHNAIPNHFNFSDVLGILEKCPHTGPRSDLSIDSGWHKDNRWIRAGNLDEGGTGHKAYNGVDFLILNNLAKIVFNK